MVNLYISYKLGTWSKDLNVDFTLVHFLFESVKLTINTDSDKYKYSGYVTGFDSRSQFSWSYGQDIYIFGVDHNSSVHIDGRNLCQVCIITEHRQYS